MPNFFDQFDEPQARITPPPAAPNFFDQFDAPDALTEMPAQLPVQTPERQALQAELDKRLTAADEAGKSLRRTEAVVGTVRPVLRPSTDLADGVLGLQKLAAAIPVGALNLAGANIRSPLSYSVAELGSDGGKSLAP